MLALSSGVLMILLILLFNLTFLFLEFLVNHDESFSKNYKNENGKRPLNVNYESDNSDKSSLKLSCRNETSSFESAAAAASNNQTSINHKLTKSISNLDINKSLIKIEPDESSLACSSNSIVTTKITPPEDSINQNNLRANYNNNNFTEDFEIIDVSIYIA